MKKTILLLITVFTIFNANAQSGSWANYELVVTPENTEKFVQAFDEFYQSEGAKNMPMALLTENSLGNQSECTHHMSFITNDAKMMSDFLNPMVFWANPDAQKLGATLGSLGIMPKRAFSGSPFVESTAFPEAQNGVQVIWSLNVPNNAQAELINGFATFIKTMQPYFDENKMELGLHQHLAGDDRGTNYWILASHKDYADYMKTMKDMSTNPNFANLFKSFGNTENTSTILRSVMKVWNSPQG